MFSYLRLLSATLVLIHVLFSSSVSTKRLTFNLDLVPHVNAIQKDFVIEANHITNYSLHHIKNLLGVKLPTLRIHKSRHEDIQFLKDSNKLIPKNFDARIAWPNCTIIKHISDQATCGSCWAVATATAFADRYCIAKGTNQYLSSEDLMTCCYECTDGGNGCNGGYTDLALKYIQMAGIVTGGDYNSSEGCKPYSIEPCENQCEEVEAPKCTRACSNDKYSKRYNNDKHYGGPVIHLGNDEKKAQSLLMTLGPLTAILEVYEDFILYKKGVYRHVAGDSLGGHAVRLIGWGEEKGLKYWLAANSWNKHWGENGLFRINRDNDGGCHFGEFVTSLPIGRK